MFYLVSDIDCVMFYLAVVSLSSVIVPHEAISEDNERCEASCTASSLGVLRSPSSLCQPQESHCPQEVKMVNMTNKLCQAWAMILPFLAAEGLGRQVVADPAVGSWLPCSVFCKTASGSWYSPRRELAEFHLSVSLPEGTLCHQTDEESLYCQGGLCLPVSGQAAQHTER